MSGDQSGSLRRMCVLEVDNQIAQYAGKLLGDLGADVIKCEPPNGSPARRIGPFYRDQVGVNTSLHFWHYNTSKRSLTINLQSPEGRSIFLQLVGKSDVVLGDFKHLASLDLDYERLSAVNPALICCSVSPFGLSGPWSDFTTNDLVHLALGGVAAVCGYDDPESPPIAPLGGQAWHIASYNAAIATLAALFHRQRSGNGQLIDVSVHDSVSVSTEWSIPFFEYQGVMVKRQTSRHARAEPSPPWIHQCQDGIYVSCLIEYLDDRQFGKLVEWFQEDDSAGVIADEQFQKKSFRDSRKDILQDEIGRYCADHDSDCIFHRAQMCGLPWAPVRAPEENLNDPHLREDRNYYQEVSHPELSEEFTYPGPPFVSKAGSDRRIKRAPLLGEHTTELLTSLGISIEDQAILAEAEAI